MEQPAASQVEGRPAQACSACPPSWSWTRDGPCQAQDQAASCGQRGSVGLESHPSLPKMGPRSRLCRLLLLLQLLRTCVSGAIQVCPLTGRGQSRRPVQTRPGPVCTSAGRASWPPSCSCPGAALSRLPSRTWCKRATRATTWPWPWQTRCGPPLGWCRCRPACAASALHMHSWHQSCPCTHAWGMRLVCSPAEPPACRTLLKMDPPGLSTLWPRQHAGC